ncbi:MAG: hypothetical protein A3J46_04705 [Candidatus Yanofskybacteria bacterium RIFCSPHIGHO2_02_FULL_41_11]|uniref:Uncharacterized protein n=1 Tax=Candidatus Yanofskybacteria bacterium RIFCSPHIGHO2_02_FULL_41_11 TaxID=1802675 RepID=A0A1F8F9L1_9BACT|nr:MAG: hypothetical protein A3J46_04705 [Candidatus Yanofskybacteria bacterium RIFCSPHIGHO2_02_FULL_41_11]
MKSYQKAIYEILGRGVIAYHASLAKALGSAKAGIFVGQLLYWYGKGRKGEWIYKTIKEMQEETYLSRREQEGAIKIAKEKGVLEVRLLGIPAKRHFRIDINKLVMLIRK